MYVLLEFTKEYAWELRRMGELNDLIKEKKYVCEYESRRENDFWILKKTNY